MSYCRDILEDNGVADREWLDRDACFLAKRLSAGAKRPSPSRKDQQQNGGRLASF